MMLIIYYRVKCTSKLQAALNLISAWADDWPLPIPISKCIILNTGSMVCGRVRALTNQKQGIRNKHMHLLTVSRQRQRQRVDRRKVQLIS